MGRLLRSQLACCDEDVIRDHAILEGRRNSTTQSYRLLQNADILITAFWQPIILQSRALYLGLLSIMKFITSHERRSPIIDAVLWAKELRLIHLWKEYATLSLGGNSKGVTKWNLTFDLSLVGSFQWHFCSLEFIDCCLLAIAEASHSLSQHCCQDDFYRWWLKPNLWVFSFHDGHHYYKLFCERHPFHFLNWLKLDPALCLFLHHFVSYWIFCQPNYIKC